MSMLDKIIALLIRFGALPKRVTENGTLVVFDYLDHTCNAIKRMRQRGDCQDYEVFSPTSYHELEHAAGFGFSPVRWFTLVLGLSGCVLGFLLCLLYAWDYPLVVGGKTPGLYSLPAYVIIGFEMTIFFGGIGTILGMLIFCKIPNPKNPVLDVRLTDDKFGVFLPGKSPTSAPVAILKECGGKEVKGFGQFAESSEPSKNKEASA